MPLVIVIYRRTGEFALKYQWVRERSQFMKNAGGNPSISGIDSMKTLY
jgi:hypothetical protein